MATPALRIALVDDHAILRQTLRMSFGMEPDFEVVAEYENGQQFLLNVPNIMPDVVLMDISMPIMDGITATQQAMALYPNLNILVLSMLSDQQHYTGMVQAGAKGFVLKSAHLDELVKAVRVVGSGENYFSQELLRQIIFKMSQPEEPQQQSLEITSREEEVLRHIAQGFTAAEIADRIHLSPKTVEGYRSNLFQKTGTKNSVSLVMYAIKNQLVEVA